MFIPPLCPGRGGGGARACGGSGGGLGWRGVEVGREEERVERKVCLQDVGRREGGREERRGGG